MDKTNHGGFGGWVSLAVIVIVIFAAYSFSTRHDECKERALAAAVAAYPMGEYPDTANRDTLQKGYEQRYIEQNCQ